MIPWGIEAPMLRILLEGYLHVSSAVLFVLFKVLFIINKKACFLDSMSRSSKLIRSEEGSWEP